MTYLSSNQLKLYEDQGYICPIEVLSNSEALEAREEIELIEKKMPNEIDKSGRYNVHLISPKLDSIVHNSKILDAEYHPNFVKKYAKLSSNIQNAVKKFREEVNSYKIPNKKFRYD